MIKYVTKALSYLKNPSTYYPIILFTILQTVFTLTWLFFGQPEVIFDLLSVYFITNPFELFMIAPFAVLSLVAFYFLFLTLLFWISVIYSKIDSKKFIGELLAIKNFKTAFSAAIAVTLSLAFLCTVGLTVLYLLSLINPFLAILGLLIGIVLMFYYMIRFIFFPFIMGLKNLNFYKAMVESYSFTKGKFWNIFFYFILLQIIAGVITYISFLLATFFGFSEEISLLAGLLVAAFNQLAIYSYYTLKKVE